MTDSKKLIAKFRENETRKRVLARYQGQEPSWRADEGSLFTGDADVTLASLKAKFAEFSAEPLNVKTAAFSPFPPKDEGGDSPFPPKEGGIGGKRNIPKDHPYDPSALKPMAKALWAASVAMGHALTAYRHLSRLKSATISPDGMLGGRGYVMQVPDMRKKVQAACEALSAVTDTLHDEITAPHWKPRLAQLDENDAEDVERFVDKSKAIMEDPEEEADEEAKEIEEENDGPGGTPKKKKPEGKKKEEASQLPGGSGGNINFSENTPAGMGDSKKEARTRVANSSVSPAELGGPRVEHLDRGGENDLPENGPEVSDGWGTPGPREYIYPSEWENEVGDKGANWGPARGPDAEWGPNLAQSAVPDSSTEDTPTEAYDFGLGYGANGQGAGGYGNPSNEGNNKGVWGPQSGLPGSPPQSSGDTTPKIDLDQNEHKSAAMDEYYSRGLAPGAQSTIGTLDQLARDLLPGDTDGEVARSDYYRGDRGNLVNTQSEMPSSAPAGGELAPSMMNTDYTYEDTSTPYVRYDYTTHDYRDDPLHEWPQSHKQG